MDLISFDELNIVCLKIERALIDSSFDQGSVIDLQLNTKSMSIRFRDKNTRNEFRIAYDENDARITIYDRASDRNHVIMIYREGFFKIMNLNKNYRRIKKLRSTVKNREILKKQKEIQEACSIIHKTYPDEIEKVLLK